MLGPRAIAEGERIAVSGNVWSIRLHRFLLGDTSALSEISEVGGVLPPGDRFVVLSEPGEARALAGELSWQARQDYIDVQVPVAPPCPRRSVGELESIDFDMNTVRSAEAGWATLQAWLGTAIGCLGSRVGSWIPEWLQVPELATKLDDLVRIEIVRLSSVPSIDERTTKLFLPLGFVEKVIAVRVRFEDADDDTIPVDVELIFVKDYPWKGELRIARQPTDPEAYDKILKELMDEASHL